MRFIGIIEHSLKASESVIILPCVIMRTHLPWLFFGIGILCVKVGAYLTQEMGFTNVSRLAGGIIAYDRTLNEKNPEEEPMFKGTNYVFDGRVGREITRDALGVCITCGGKTNLLSNCKNVDCHKRIVQCNDCIDPFGGCCSDACKEASIHKYSLKKVTD